MSIWLWLVAAVVATIEAAEVARGAIAARQVAKPAEAIQPLRTYFKPYKAPLTRLLLEVAGQTVGPVLRVAIPYLQPLHPPGEVVVVKMQPTVYRVAAVVVVAAAHHQQPGGLVRHCKAVMAQRVSLARVAMALAVAVVELLLPELPLLEQMPPTAGMESRRQLVDQALREVVAVVVVLMSELTPEALEQGEVEVAEVLVQLAAPQLLAPLILVVVAVVVELRQRVELATEHLAAQAS